MLLRQLIHTRFVAFPPLVHLIFLFPFCECEPRGVSMFSCAVWCWCSWRCVCNTTRCCCKQQQTHTTMNTTHENNDNTTRQNTNAHRHPITTPNTHHHHHHHLTDTRSPCTDTQTMHRHTPCTNTTTTHLTHRHNTTRSHGSQK